MRSQICLSFIGILALVATSVLAGEDSGSINPKEGWNLLARVRNIAIYSRPHPGSSIKEFAGVGMIEASTRTVRAVLDDFDNYPNFMPFTTECHLVKREGESVIGYQRISPGIIADRDYTLRVWNQSWPTSNGLVFLSQWTSANELGPPETEGVVRVKICNGHWLLEPDGKDKTRATYSVFTDIGGVIPAFLANHVSKTGIVRVFQAVRTQAKNPKYIDAD